MKPCGDSLWCDFVVTLSSGWSPSECEGPLCPTIRCSDGCLPLAAAKLICPVYRCLIFFRPAVMTFPEQAFKGSFIEAHSSTLTASSSSRRRYLRSHNDYLTESWLNALFRWEGMYSSGNAEKGDVDKAFYCSSRLSGIHRNAIAPFGTSLLSDDKQTS